jgi:molybdate transport system substrate-binding protein
MALVDSVPAGIYGKAALRSLSLWDEISAKVAQTDNVRAALALVVQGEAPFGIVYATDAKASGAATVVATFPADSHPPIIYPVAGLEDAPDAATAADFLRFLSGPTAAAIFAADGFTPLVP